jgi:hypothetical protein
VRGHRFRRAVDLDEDETRSVILLLDKIEARDAWFLNAGAGVLNGGLAEFCNRFRFDMHANVNDKHRKYL